MPGRNHTLPHVLWPRYGADMQILGGIISFVVALAGIWTVTGYFVPGWATAVGVALVVIVSFAHAGTLDLESLGWKRSQDKASSESCRSIDAVRWGPGRLLPSGRQRGIGLSEE